MRFLVSTGYAWNRVRTLILGLSGKLLILANNLNLRFVGNATVITQQIRNAWDSYGLPFPQMLLNAAWLHNEPILDTEIVDETPNVDASRPTHKARALQFTSGSDYVSISKTYPSTDTPTSFEVTLEVITGDSIVSTQDIFCTDDAGQAAGIQLRIENYLSDWRFGLRVGNVVGRDSSFAVETNTRYILVISYDGTDATLTVNEATNLTITPTSAIAGAGLIILGRRYTTLGNYFNGILGYVKIKEDNIVIGEYAFEEGEGTICYNRVMNNFHGTINNATISTFRVEDVRITNGDQGTFLNTDGYTNTFQFLADGTYGTIPIDTSSATNMSIRWKSLTDLSVHQLYFSSNQGDHWLGYYPSSATNFVNENHLTLNGDIIVNGTIVANTGTAVRSQMVDDNINTFEVTGLDISTWPYLYINRYSSSGFNTRTNILSIEIDLDGDGVYEYEWDADLKAVKSHSDISITGSDYNNLLIPRPRVTDIPLYNAGKYAYYIPDHANNYIDLNTAFAGLTKEGDWMEFGIATVGTGEPDSESGNWVTYTGGNSRFFANITSGVDFRFFGPNGGQNQMRTTIPSIDIPNGDFYLLRVTKTVEAPAGTSGTVGQLDIFDRNGNLIVSHTLSAGTLGNEGTYSFDRFFPSTYGTDFILAYLKLSDGTVWNGVNDFNGGVNITNTGTGNITKIFFESVDEDVLGNPLTYKGQVAQPLSLVNSNGIRFSDQEQIELTNDLTVSDFTEIAYVYFDSTLASGTFMRALFFYDTGSSADGWVTIENNELRYGNSASGGTQSPYQYTTIPNFLDTWQKVGISRTGSEIVIVVGDEVRTADISAVAAGTNTFEAIGRFGNNPQGDLAWISFHSKGMTAEEIKAIDPYNMDTDSLEVFYAPSVGNGSTVYDLSGENNHGTIQNATLSNFWIKQDQLHWNLKKGFLKGFGTSNNAYYNLDQPFEDPFGKTVKFGFVYNTGSSRQWLFTTDVSDIGSFYVQYNNGGGSIQIEQQGVNSTIHISGSNFTDGHYYEVEFDYPATSDLQTVSTVLLNGDSVSFTTSGGIYGSSGNHIGYNSIGGFPLTDTRIVFIKIGDTLYSELNNWGGATLVNSGSAEYLRVPDLATENVAFAAGKWHNDAETEINFPHTAKLHMINEQFDYKPFFYKNAQLDDATAAYSMRKVIADYEGPLLNVIRSSDLQAQDFYPDSRGDLDTAAITSFVNDATPVLDDYSDVATAYSLRKVRTAYTGDAIEVRRSSDGDLQGIGFDANGDLDTTTLLAFVNAEYTLADEDFSSSTGWNLGTGVSITGGVMRANTSGTVTAYKNFGDPGAQQVRVTFTISNYVSGSVRYMNFATSTTGTLRTANGTYTEILTLQEGGNFNHGLQMFNTFVGDIDDFEIVQLTADGAVTTWYDQTENDFVNQNNATQSDQEYMPLIVERGIVVLENGKSAIKFRGQETPNHLLNDNITLSSSDSTYVIVARHQASGNVNFYDSGENVKFFLQFNNNGRDAVFDVDGTGGQVNLNYDSDSNSRQRILSMINLGNGTLEASFNGVVTKTTSSLPVVTRNGLTLGGHRDRTGTNSLDGILQEFIIFSSDQSDNRTGIEGNIGRYYTIDGFTDGRVATWYDQANANHATQATSDEQPLIVNDGVLVTENSKPAIDFDGVDDSFTANALAGLSRLDLFFATQTSDTQYVHFSEVSSIVDRGFTANDNDSASGLPANMGTPTMYNNGAEFTGTTRDDVQIAQDGHQVISYIDADTTGFATFEIGGHGSYIFDGKLQELIAFNSDQSRNRQDIEKNIADYYDITLSGNAGVESWVKNVSFADMYQIWFDYEYLHKLFANFEVPNQVNKILAYVTELTIEQRETIVYPYLKEDYHPIYTPYQQRVQADSGDTDAGKTNTLNKIDNI